ncbi:MAG: hypothetical protein ACI3VN_06830 [Candidatus Onthomonas sp.]
MMLLLAFLLCCAACGQGDSGEPLEEAGGEIAPAAGILSEEEIAAYEALYRKSQEETLDALGLKAENAFQLDEIAATFTDAREIEGQMFLCALNFSESEDYQGFYGVDFRAVIPADQENLLETVKAIHQDALDQYGTPSTYEGLGEILSDQLENGSWTGVEDWVVGDQSTFRMWVNDMGDEVALQLHYQIAVSY